ncbi:MAG: serine phosphatase RsbU (regulator of sigma subunit) [Flammeovirgaceae bacterium]|jgi:serine phosphatase RsbU (regulator of sigma subunit)
MTNYFRFSFICLFLFCTGWVHAQSDLHAIHGRVIDEHGVSISGVKITVNDNAVALSDASGNFSVNMSDKVTQVEATKSGYNGDSGQKMWWIESGDSEFIFVRLHKTPSFHGKITDEKGVALPKLSVKLSGDVSFGTVSTDARGEFHMELPADMKVSDETIFIIGGKKVPAENIALQSDFVAIVIPTVSEKVEESDPTSDETKKDNETNTEGDSEVIISKKVIKDKNKKKYDVLLMDETEFPLAFLEISIGQKKYKSNAEGKFSYESDEFSPADFQLESSYMISQIDIERRARKIYVQVRETRTTEMDSLLTEDEITEGYLIEMNHIIKGLQQENMVLTAKAIALRGQIARLAERLGKENNISPKRKEELSRELLKLEDMLEENDIAYREARANTSDALARLKEMLKLSEAEKYDISAKARKERIILLLMILAVATIATVFFILGKRIRKQNNELELVKGELENKVKEVNSKNDRILAQTDKLKSLNHSISAQNQKMTDSIQYAKTIQQAVLPTFAEMDKSLEEYFIIYKPKEIVSGDFYWFSQVESDSGKSKLLLATIDCTGHGVPGGFMSMIGNTLLNEIINKKKIYETADILNELNKGVKEALKQNEKLNADGMDVCLCTLENLPNNQVEITFSGAKRPLFYVKPATKEVGYLKGDMQIIGGSKLTHRPFGSQKLTLEKGDIVYLTSDGLGSQGTSKIGKIGTSRIKQLLAENASLPLTEQKVKLENLLNQYQVKEAQRDDILVFGVRV